MWKSCDGYAFIVTWRCVVEAESANRMAAGWTDEETKALIGGFPCSAISWSAPVTPFHVSDNGNYA